MDIQVVPFAPEHIDMVAQFSQRYWSRPRTESFYKWRYLDPASFSRMFLAIRGRECVGMLFALRKRYLISGREVPCLEVFDWHSLPELKGTGVGIRLMRAMMRQPERLIAIGGTADVLSTLPAMGWQRIGVARRFELPLSGEFLAAGLQRRTGVPAWASRFVLDAFARTWFAPRIRARPGTGSVLAVSAEDSKLESLYRVDSGYDVLQVPEPNILGWLGGSSDFNGSIEYLFFAVRGVLRGWAVTRLYDTAQGREGAILDVFAPQPDRGLYSWMVAEAGRSLAGKAPRMIRARATCPVLMAALRANRYRETETDVPVHSWPTGLTETSRLHLTLNHSDEPLRPYLRGPAPHDAP